MKFGTFKARDEKYFVTNLLKKNKYIARRNHNETIIYNSHLCCFEIYFYV